LWAICLTENSSRRQEASIMLKNYQNKMVSVVVGSEKLKIKKTMEKEQKISMYDPSVNAYREISIEKAKKFVESAKEVEKKLEELSKENNN